MIDATPVWGEGMGWVGGCNYFSDNLVMSAQA